METRYICTGGCGGRVSEEEHTAGKTVCGTAGCPKFGQPFTKIAYCTECGADVEQGAAHSHERKGGLFSWLPWMK